MQLGTITIVIKGNGTDRELKLYQKIIYSPQQIRYGEKQRNKMCLMKGKRGPNGTGSCNRGDMISTSTCNMISSNIINTNIIPATLHLLKSVWGDELGCVENRKVLIEANTKKQQIIIEVHEI